MQDHVYPEEHKLNIIIRILQQFLIRKNYGVQEGTESQSKRKAEGFKE